MVLHSNELILYQLATMKKWCVEGIYMSQVKKNQKKNQGASFTTLRQYTQLSWWTSVCTWEKKSLHAEFIYINFVMYSHTHAHINSMCNLTSAVPSNSKVQADISSGSNPLNCKCKTVHSCITHRYTTLHTPHKHEQLYTRHKALCRQEQTWCKLWRERK